MHCRLLPHGLPQQQEATLAPLLTTLQPACIVTILAAKPAQETQPRRHRRPVAGACGRSQQRNAIDASARGAAVAGRRRLRQDAGIAHGCAVFRG